MKTIFWGFLLAGGAIFLHNCTWTTNEAQAQAVSQPESTADLVKRGEYLITTMGCNDCRTPKVMTDHGPDLDRSRLMSGHPADVPLAPIADKEAVRKGDWVLMHPMVTAFVGPWGTSYAANLTPDATGIGSWNFEQFKKAVTEGKYKGLDGGRMLLPPMPWFNLTKMTDADLKAMFAYLQALPPVKNVVPAPAPPTEI
ncbi:MAG: diheme cytochrome c-553 [Saprospiraceae bacterium]